MGQSEAPNAREDLAGQMNLIAGAPPATGAGGSTGAVRLGRRDDLAQTPKKGSAQESDMTKALAELGENNLDVISGIELNQAAFDALVKFSQQTDKIGGAIDNVRKFFFKRAFSGDFVTHNGKTVNPSGPGAERILSALGLASIGWSLTNWEKHKDEGVDKLGQWYTHWYTAEATLGGMKLGRLEGRAGSRDKLFGFKNGSYKDLSEVKEPDIQMAARRCVYKELVRIGLGMRNIPINEAVAMGLDESKIAKIEFGKEGEQKVDAPASGSVVVVKDVKAFAKKDVGEKGTPGFKKGWTRYDVIDDKGAKYSTFSEKLAEIARGFVGKQAKVSYSVGKYGPELSEIVEATAPDPEPGDNGADS